MLQLIWRVVIFTLMPRALALPDCDLSDAGPVVLAARLQSSVEPELVVSLAWAESRFRTLPGRYCGVMQVEPEALGLPREATCSSPYLGVEAGVAELVSMLHDSRVRGDLRLALLYRACGNSAFGGGCAKTGWVDAALARAARLREVPRG